MQVWEQTGEKPKQLAEQPDPPKELVYLWGWVCEIPGQLEHTEVRNWALLTGRDIAPWEVEVMFYLDRMRTDG